MGLLLITQTLMINPRQGSVEEESGNLGECNPWPLALFRNWSVFGEMIIRLSDLLLVTNFMTYS